MKVKLRFAVMQVQNATFKTIDPKAHGVKLLI